MTKRTLSFALGALCSALSSCGGGGGGGGSFVPLAISSFTASPAIAERGEVVTLVGVFQGGAGFVNEGGGEAFSGDALDVIPTATTLYTLTVDDGFGNAVTLEVLVRVFDRVFHVTSAADSGAFTLRQAILDANAAAPDSSAIVFDLTTPATIPLASDLPPIAADVAIVGPGARGDLTIDGGGSVRPFFVADGQVSIEHLTVASGLAQGGDGGSLSTGSAGGGGGAGMGGGVFVDGGDVRIEDVAFSGNTATGGSGGASGSESTGPCGGGGMGTNGLPGVGNDGGRGGDGDGFGTTGGAGGVFGGAGPVAGGEGGGGGGSAEFDGAGASGGFGGGGGGGWSQGGGGGVGGGGSGSDNPSFGAEGIGGTFGGSGNPGNLGGGGGGAGLGGAIFVRFGRLRLSNVAFTSNVATGGPGGGVFFFGASGLGKGGAVFVLAPAEATGESVTFSGNAASDDAGVPGDDNDIFGSISPAP